MHPIWPALVLVVVAPLVGRGYWRRRSETRKLLHLARSKGLTFSPVDMIGLHERYYNLELIRQGHNRHAWNILYGSTEMGLVAMFRYSFDLGFGVHQSSRHCWMIVLERSRIPQASMRGEFNLQSGTFLASTVLFDEPTTQAVMLEFSRDWQVEFRGNLLAIAAPWDESSALPERLLNSVDQLARALIANRK